MMRAWLSGESGKSGDEAGPARDGAALSVAQSDGPELTGGTGVFVRFDDEPEDRPFHHGFVLTAAQQVCVVELRSHAVGRHRGGAQIYYHEETGFYGAPALREVLLQSYPRPVIRFLITGPAQRVERRREARVPVPGESIKADFALVRRCPMLDLSTEGFSIAGPDIYNIGDTLPTTLRHEQSEAMGWARVMNRMAMPDGRVRYGLMVAEAQAPLRHWLRTTSAEARRKMLNRLASKR